MIVSERAIQTAWQRKAEGQPTGAAGASGIVADGNRRLAQGIEAEVRREVEAKYADEWNGSGLWNRWRLQKKIDKEVADILSRRLSNVSPESLF